MTRSTLNLFVLSFTLGLFTFSDIHAQWYKVNTGTNTDIHDIHFSSPGYGFMCGQNSLFMYSHDSGKTWTQNPVTICNYRSVFFIDSMRGVMVGDNAYIMLTTDGGKIWSRQHYIFTSYLYHVTFHDSLFGLAVGKDGLILRSANGGGSWVADTVPVSGIDIRHSAITTNGTCYAVGDNGTIFRKNLTDNKWKYMPSPTSVNLNHVAVFDEDRLIITGGESDSAGYSNILMRSTDSGKTFQTFAVPGSRIIESAYWKNYDTGVVCGSNGRIVRCYFPSFQFSQYISGTPSSLHSLMYNGVKTFAAGDGGILLWTPEIKAFGMSNGNVEKSQACFQVYPVPSLNDTYFITGDLKLKTVHAITHQGQKVKLKFESEGDFLTHQVSTDGIRLMALVLIDEKGTEQIVKLPAF